MAAIRSWVMGLKMEPSSPLGSVMFLVGEVSKRPMVVLVDEEVGRRGVGSTTAALVEVGLLGWAYIKRRSNGV